MTSFNDFYDTQNTLIEVLQKLSNKIQEQDDTIMRFGNALNGIPNKPKEIKKTPQLEVTLFKYCEYCDSANDIKALNCHSCSAPFEANMKIEEVVVNGADVTYRDVKKE